MLKNLTEPKDIRDAMLSLLPTSGTLAGIAIGLAGFISEKQVGTSTLADDILLIAALGFLIVCYLIFFALRTISAQTTSKLMQLIDVVFLGALTLVVFSGFVVVYEFM